MNVLPDSQCFGPKQASGKAQYGKNAYSHTTRMRFWNINGEPTPSGIGFFPITAFEHPRLWFPGDRSQVQASVVVQVGRYPGEPMTADVCRRCAQHAVQAPEASRNIVRFLECPRREQRDIASPRSDRAYADAASTRPRQVGTWSCPYNSGHADTVRSMTPHVKCTQSLRCAHWQQR
jgi:hypothetical protein